MRVLTALGRISLLCAAATMALLTPAYAVSSNYKDVCTTGCTYSSVQAAIDAITDSSATNVYTVFIDSGVLSTDASITILNKSYINLVGRGMGVSVIRASTTWFNNGAGGNDSTVDLFTLDGATNITIRGVTIDAKTNYPTGLGAGVGFNGLNIKNGNRIVIDGAEVLGIVYGIWEEAATAGNLIEMFGSKVKSAVFGIFLNTTTWHVFDSDIRGVRAGENTVAQVGGITSGSNTVHATFWSTHLHAETSTPAESNPVGAVYFTAGSGTLDLIGCTLHVKMTTADVGSSSRGMAGLYWAAGTHKINIIGGQLIYESPASLSQGRIGGLVFIDPSSAATLNLIGTDFRDVGGSGGTARADVVGAPIVSTVQPTVRNAGTRIASIIDAGSQPIISGFASLDQTLNTQRGTVTLSGGQAIVSLPANSMPDTAYSVAVTGNASETFYVISKATTGFTIKSSNTSSTAVVDWTLTR